MFEDKLLKLSETVNRISLLRLFIFLTSCAILIALASFKLFILFFIVLLISAICFSTAINFHSKAAFLKKHTAFLKNINESEILREECILREFDTGEQFIDQNHHYTSDLDIFGEHSIFQLVNRTTTESGMILLSKWLSEPATNNEISERQKAIKELSQKLDWRQDFQASGMHFKNKKSDYYKLLDWVQQPYMLLKYRHLYTAIAIILPMLFFVSLYFFYDSTNSLNRIIYASIMILVLYINYMILRKVKHLAEHIYITSQDNIDTLKGYQALINKIERESFETQKLNHLQTILKRSKYSAFKEIKRLCGLLDFSQQRGIKNSPIGGNSFYPLLNSFLLIDIYLIIGTEKWKLKNKAFLKSWAEVVSEFEVINSFAGFCFSNPSYTFPEISEKTNYADFELLGHPLISSKKRICNDFLSDGQGNVVLITGSNMAGKSTFLRTVGVNIVLALAGAPCCAIYAQVSNLQLFTSMRTQDNLKEGISSFYAELERIEKMLKLIENNYNVFFLLDEMFKGTNSEDRHRGGFSLINQISKLKASGIIATHDIELAKLLEKKSLVTNYSFNSEIKNDLMHFSYRLHPAICNDFNASELMKKSGINILSNF